MAGPSYGSGFIDLEPKVSRDSLATIKRQIDQVFSNVKFDIDTRAFGDVDSALNRIESSAAGASGEMAEIASRADSASGDFTRMARGLGASEDSADRFAGSMRTAAREVDKVDDKTRGLSGNMSSLRSAAGGVAAAFAAIGAGQLLSQGVRGANAAIQSFAQLEDSANAVNVIFGQASDGVLEFGETAARSAGLSETAFNQAVVPIGALLQNFGVSAGEASKAAVTLVQRGADLASVYGGTVQDALLAVGAALRGEADPLERYGASISAARVQAFALAEGMAATNAEITPAITLQARLGLILSDTAKVSGDYLNTAGDLANAQRTAGAEAANFGTDVGEVLAPALEAMVAVLPEVLEGVRQLVPSFAAAGDSAASFFKEAGAGGGFGFREFGADLRVLGGTFGDVFGSIGDLATAVFAGVATNADAADAAMERLNERGAQFELRDIGVTLAKQLDQGVKPLDAFSTAVTRLGKNKEAINSFRQGYRDFAIQANLTKKDLSEATAAMIANGKAAGLSDAEISVLRLQYTALNEELLTSPRLIDDTSAALDRIPAGPASSAMDLVRAAAEEAGVSLDEFALSTDPVITALLATLTPAEQSALRIAAIGSSVQVATDFLTASFRPALVDASAALVDLNEDGKVTFDEFIKSTREATTAALQFKADLATIAGLSPEVALHLSTLEVEEAHDLLAEVAADPNKVIAIELELQGRPKDIRNVIDAAVDAAIALIKSNPDQKQIDDLTAIITSLDLPAVTAAFERVMTIGMDEAAAHVEPPDLGEKIEAGFTQLQGVRDAAAVNAAEYEEATRDALRGGDFALQIEAMFKVDLSDEGELARATYFLGLSTRGAGETGQLRQSIIQSVSAATSRQSPPKLFLDLGEEAGAAYWSGFGRAPFTFPGKDLAVSSMKVSHSATIEAGTDTPAGTSPLIGQIIVNNPTGEPTEDSLADPALAVHVNQALRR